jgi:Na+:H+ antiporter, NhaA family
MHRPEHRSSLPSAQLVAEKVFNALERFLHVEAVSGVVLLITAAAALLWANSTVGDSYEHFWHAPVTFGFADLVISQSLHFWINDGLMTIFFLVVGLEIRREIYEGALASLRLAALPLVAALGGVMVPALIYVGWNADPSLRHGWAVPTATDIAFAVGVLALLGRSIPSSVRILLLALAIIDDIAAVLIIALFYSAGLDAFGFLIAFVGVLLVLAFQRIGIGSAFAYVIPGLVVWAGFLYAGIHPTLAGVLLGLMTPVVPLARRERPIDILKRAVDEFGARVRSEENDPRALLEPVKQLKRAQREILPPVVRVQAALHPWVAYGIMPLFALANAGVAIGGLNLGDWGAQSVMFGVLFGLVLGKPIGIVLASWAAVRVGWVQLPPGVTWRGVWLVGCLGGIGFTMSIFIATLAFRDSAALLNAAKLGVLTASACAAIVGLIIGKLFVVNTGRSEAAQSPAEVNP